VCLGIPGQVAERAAEYAGQLAVVGGRRHVDVGMLADEPLEPGDWVLIHLGFAVEKVDEEPPQRARARLELVGPPRELEREERS